MAKHITSVEPREQVGPKTGALFEFQYGEAALACLELLGSTDGACVYCEWHDDFVVERDSPLPYEFMQVKSRSGQNGPWSLSEILGVVGQRPRPAPLVAAHASGKPPKTSKPAKLKSAAEIGIAERMLEHIRRFPDACRAFALVSTHEVKDDLFLDLIEAARALRHDPTATVVRLTSSQQTLFSEIVAAYRSRDSSVTANEVWVLISRLDFSIARGRPNQPDVIIGLMGQRIEELSEVDLRAREQRRVASGLIDLVRRKSHCVIDFASPPESNAVRTAKSVDIDEVLNLLALSPSGFRALRTGAGHAARTLSRLHRLCEKSGMDPSTVEIACRLRIEWEQWKTRHRDQVADDLLLVVVTKGAGLLQALRLAGSGMEMEQFRNRAALVADDLAKLTELPPIDAKTIMGLVFALASDQPDG